MKRLLLSLLVVTAVSASVTAGTMAVFSDTKSVLGNTISTATVKLDIRALTSGEIPKPLTVTNLVPNQWTKWARAELYNQSSVAIKMYIYADNMTGVACDKTNLQVTTGYAGSNTDERANSLYNGPLSGFVGSANRREVNIISPNVPANETRVIQQHAQLDTSAGNTYQGTTCTWDEIVVIETEATPAP